MKRMKPRSIFTIALCFSTAIVVLSQTPAGPTNVQGPQDPGYEALIKTCKVAPPARGAAGGQGGAAAAQGQNRGAAAAAPAAAPALPDLREYTVTEIPGVIAAGQRWRTIWQAAGNVADGIMGTDDGGVMIAQNDNGAVVKIDRDGKASTVYTDTRTGGSLSMNTKGALFVAQRALNMAIWQLAPQRRLFANKINGDPLDCIGGTLNDMSADSKGGVYFTMGGVFYANPQGVVTRYGQNLTTNGVILSPDEKTLYVTNGPTLAAFDVQPDGSLTNQREFAKFQDGGGDGAAVDAAGRIYVTLNRGSGIQVFAADGKSLGLIPTPRNVISTAFSGPDKKSLFAVVSYGPRPMLQAEVITIPMIAQGFRGRAK